MDDHVKIVKRGEYGGYEYFITEVCNAWYCAYIILPEGHKYYGVKDYDSIPLEVHGGLTFADKHRLVDGKWCIGWDYGHYGDWSPLTPDHLQVDFWGVPFQKWTPGMIEMECKCVIDDLNEAE